MPTYLLLGLLICVLAAAFDLTRGTIPNALTVPLLVIALPLQVFGALASGEALRGALLHGAAALLGIAVCALVPLVMWRKQALGGGDLKLFAGLGGLLSWRIGVELEWTVLLLAALAVPARWAYQGRLLRTFGSMFQSAFALARPRARRVPLDQAVLGSVRLGPCFALAACVELLLHWRSL